MSKKNQVGARRVFSESLRRHGVSQIEQGKQTVLGLSRDYGVSTTCVYKWIKKYSRHLHSGQTIVIQMEQEEQTSKALQQRIVELEAALGRKQLEIDFLNRLIEQGKQELNIDLKKKYSTPPSHGSGPIKGSTFTS